MELNLNKPTTKKVNIKFKTIEKEFNLPEIVGDIEKGHRRIKPDVKEFNSL